MEDDEDKDCAGGGQCNPPFPSDSDVDEIRIRGDAIGTTLYSERWVIKTLMKLVKLKDEECSHDLETDLCLLWDMAMEPDVVQLLMDHQFLELSVQIIKTTSVSRLTEILLGIMSNMSCVQSVRERIAQDAELVELLLNLLSLPDALSLLQLSRLLQTCLSNTWVKHLCPADKWTGSVVFILASSTNKDLLMSVLAFLETVCYVPCSHDLLAHHVVSSDAVNAILEALKQLHSCSDIQDSDLEKAASHAAQILSCFASFTAGGQALGEHAQALSDALTAFLVNATEQHVAFLSAAVVIMGTILDACGFFCPAVFNCFLSQLVRLQALQDKTHEDLVDSLAQYFRLVVQVADKDLLAEVLQNCSADQVQVLQGVMTSK